MLKTNTFLDRFLGGGLLKETISCFYGPPGSGKTTICFLYAISCLKEGKKVIYIDTEGGFSPERLHQLGGQDLNLENIVVFKPKNFDEQIRVISSLAKEIKNNKSFGLIIVDSLVMLYRLKLGDDPQKTNNELANQLQVLTELSRTFEIPILVTNQMYQDFETKRTRMVGGLLLDYWSKTIVEVEREGDLRKLILQKHKFKKEGEFVRFELKNNGIFETKAKGFKLF